MRLMVMFFFPFTKSSRPWENCKSSPTPPPKKKEARKGPAQGRRPVWRADLTLTGGGNTSDCTYKINGHAECGKDGLLRQVALHIWWRERIRFWVSYIEPARTRLHPLLIDLESASSTALGTHVAAHFGEVLLPALNEDGAAALQSILACCDLFFAAIRSRPVV